MWCATRPDPRDDDLGRVAQVVRLAQVKAPETIPQDDLVQFVRATTGSAPTRWRDRSRGPGGASVARVLLRDGREVVVKRSGTREKHRREVAAYRSVAAAEVGTTARLLADDEVLPALLLDALPGRPDLPATAAEAPLVHELAGRWLARFHRAPSLAPDPLPLDVAYRLRAERCSVASAGVVDEAARRRIEEGIVDALPALARRTRVPCHRDFTERNWLVDDGRLTGVIDFEHARDDVAESDLVRLASRVWPVRPDLRDAFLRGYRQERGPADPDAPWMPALVALEALATVAWARRHSDVEAERSGRTALQRCLS